MRRTLPTMSTDQPKQSPVPEQTPEQTPKSIHNDMFKLKDKLAKDMEGTSTRDKGIFRKLDEFEQQYARKKIMRMILATLPPILDEQDAIKFKNKK